MILTLLQNISLLVSIAVVFHFVERRLGDKPFLASLLGGLLFGVAAIIAMLTPFRFSDGIIYDGRTIILAAASLFGGPIAAGIATAAALALRIFYIGGLGKLAGAMSIITAASVGLISYYWRSRSRKPLGFSRIMAIGFIVHLLMLASQFLLPDNRWKTVMPVIALPVLTLYPLGFFFICSLFLDNEERLKNIALLRESEARYKILFQSHNSIMLLIDDKTGGIIDANPAAEAFYGWKISELQTMNIQDIDMMEPERQREQRELARKGDRRSFLLKHRRACGDIRDVEVFSGPIEYLGNTILYAIVHDATPRIQAETEVRELTRTLEQRVAKRTEELEEANKELESFAYSVSHDLKAPLRAMEGFSNLLAEEAGADLSPSMLHYIDRINYNAKKTSRLIDDILRLSRISRQSLVISDIDFSKLAADTAAEVAAAYPDKKVELTVQAGIKIRADKALMEQLLANLLENAWKFTSSIPDARIRVESLDSEGKTIYVVSDNGAGFDMAYVDKLFTPFQRLHTETEYPGSGIGLSIVRRIVARHGGQVWAKASPNEGAAFYFTLGG